MNDAAGNDVDREQAGQGGERFLREPTRHPAIDAPDEVSWRRLSLKEQKPILTFACKTTWKITVAMNTRADSAVPGRMTRGAQATGGVRPGPVSVSARVLGFALAAGVSMPTLMAADLEVNTTADVVADDGRCTLREALWAINRRQRSGDAPGECAAGDGHDDTVQLPAGTYVLDDRQHSGGLSLRRSARIVGAGRRHTAVEVIGSERGIAVEGVATRVGIDHLQWSWSSPHGPMLRLSIRSPATP